MSSFCGADWVWYGRKSGTRECLHWAVYMYIALALEERPGQPRQATDQEQPRMTNVTSGLFLSLFFLLCLLAAETLAVSTFHKDVAFSYIDTEGTAQFPSNTYDSPPLLDRRGTGAVFKAPFPGTYVFSFHSPSINSSETYYQLNREHIRSVTPLLRLDADGPVAGHVIVDLEVDDLVRVEMLSGSGAAIVNTTTPIIFNGFLLYHRCLCSPLVLRQSVFSAYRSIDVGTGSLPIDGSYVLSIGRQDEFNPSTGIFKASLPGIYVFMYSFPHTRNGLSNTVDVSLTVNGVVKSSLTLVSSTEEAGTMQYPGTTVVLDLAIGDEVTLQKGGVAIEWPPPINGTNPSDPVSPILFSGFLL